MSGESMAARTLGKINGRLRFFYRRQNFLDFSFRRLLANALIQPQFDFACSAWLPMLNKRLTKEIQTAQNKCIRFCSNMSNRAHIGVNEFKTVIWLPTKGLSNALLQKFSNFVIMQPIIHIGDVLTS